MKRAIILLLALTLALPLRALGEGSDMAVVDAFIERAGIEADEATRDRIDAFLRSRYISAQVLDMIEDARLQRYAEYLANDWPIDYPELLEAPSEPLPGDAAIRQIAVLQPQGAATESMLADFERGVVYYDPTFPVPEDVCRAEYAGALSEAHAEALRSILSGMTLADWAGRIDGMELGTVRVAVAWEGGVTRCVAAGEGVPEDFINGVMALLDEARAAAQGDDL